MVECLSRSTIYFDYANIKTLEMSGSGYSLL